MNAQTLAVGQEVLDKPVYLARDLVCQLEGIFKQDLGDITEIEGCIKLGTDLAGRGASTPEIVDEQRLCATLEALCDIAHHGHGSTLDLIP